MLSWPKFCIIFTGLVLLYFKVLIIIHNPLIIGDGHTRLDHANSIIVSELNRAWLPFLQMHIWVFYKLGLPFWAFKLIPVFYFFIATVFLGLLVHRIINKDPQGLIFTIFSMVCFAFQPGVDFVSTSIYQESIEMAFFYILLYKGILDLKKSWFVFTITLLSLITRDTFFVYLLVLTILNYKKILADKQLFSVFMCCWAVPVVWYATDLIGTSIVLKHYPALPWMLRNISDPSNAKLFNINNLLASFQFNRIYFLIFTLILGFFFIKRFGEDLKSKNSSHVDDHFKIFSLLSLGIVYFIYMYFDIWQATFANPRIAMPLVPHLFIWMAIFFKETNQCPRLLKIILRICLVTALLYMSYPGIFNLKTQYMDTAYVHDIGELRKQFFHKLRVCFITQNEWESQKFFLGPALYMEREYIQPQEAHDFAKDNVVIAPVDVQFKNNLFLRWKDIKVKDDFFTIYVRQGQ